MFAIFTFAGLVGIDDTMVALARGGMKIRGVLDPGQATQDWAAPKTMKHPNIELFVPKKEGVFKNLRKLHHKLMVIDERIVVAGSFNYTAAGERLQRREPVRDRQRLPEGREHHGRRAGCQALAKHMKAEIERIIANSTAYVP